VVSDAGEKTDDALATFTTVLTLRPNGYLATYTS